LCAIGFSPDHSLVILRQSTIIFVVLLSFVMSIFYREERPTLIALVCCVGLSVGTVLSSLALTQSFQINAVGAVLLTILSSLLQAGMIVSMRLAFLRVGHLFASPLEAVAFKMSVAAIIMLPVSLGLDMGGWARLGDASDRAKVLVGCGVLVTGTFASLQVTLQSLAGAVSMAVLSTCVIIPQVLLSLLVLKNRPLDALHIAGYVISPVFATLYGVHRAVLFFRASRTDKVA
jgi:hypothetical protein